MTLATGVILHNRYRIVKLVGQDVAERKATAGRAKRGGDRPPQSARRPGDNADSPPYRIHAYSHRGTPRWPGWRLGA